MPTDCWLDYGDLLKQWEWFVDDVETREDEWEGLTIMEDNSWLGGEE